MNLTSACLCLMFVAAPTPKVPSDAEKLVGTWKLVKSTNMPQGLTIELFLELTKNGKMIVRQSAGGMELGKLEGEYKLNKKELPYTLKLPGGGIKKETLTVKKLTEKELQVVDPDGVQEDFERVKKDEKKDEK